MGSMRSLAVMLSLLIFAAPAGLSAKSGKKTEKAEKAAKVKKADRKTVKAVKIVIDMPVERLAPEAVEGFMAIDPLSLPRRLRGKFKAKILEFNVLKHLAKKKKKGYIRRPTLECEPGEGSKSTDIRALKMAGFLEIKEEEEAYIMKRTECTELDLMCEFSLQIGLEKLKNGKIRRRLFLHERDPLHIIIDEYRSGRGARQTKFFGSGVAKCKH